MTKCVCRASWVDFELSWICDRTIPLSSACLWQPVLPVDWPHLATLGHECQGVRGSSGKVAGEAADLQLQCPARGGPAAWQHRVRCGHWQQLGVGQRTERPELGAGPDQTTAVHQGPEALELDLEPAEITGVTPDWSTIPQQPEEHWGFSLYELMSWSGNIGFVTNENNIAQDICKLCTILTKEANNMNCLNIWETNIGHNTKSFKRQVSHFLMNEILICLLRLK